MTPYPIPMGEEIIPEETTDKPKIAPKQVLKERLVKVVSRIKRPKAITLVILFSTIILVSIALSVLSKKNQEEIIAPPDFQSGSTAPIASQEPTNENIAQRVKLYNDKLNLLKNFNQDLPKPIVDLDISFK